MSAGMNLLIVGGAGYIGSHMVKLLLERGHQVTTLDNLSTGYREAILGGEFKCRDLSDRAALDALFQSQRFDGVMHFASFIEVGESVANPRKYYRNNLVNTLNLLDSMITVGVKCFVFSSSAAIFGEPRYLPIDEKHEKRPINPYGASKWMVEQILEHYDRAYGLKSISLRYFNAAGAAPDGSLGERHDPETHLIPLVLQAASGRRDTVTVFGREYDTRDGTCIRDYIHVEDLCQAHLLAVESLLDGADSNAFNLGNGNGFSVQEVIAAARVVTGADIPVTYCARREGDPARLVADSTKARLELHWYPRFDLKTIIQHAWQWEQKGYLIRHHSPFKV
jgi:UDP-glucose 4-epimerase